MLYSHLFSIGSHLPMPFSLPSPTFDLPYPSLSSCRDGSNFPLFLTLIQGPPMKHPSSRVIYRRNVPQKAWTSGMNPITQRSTTSSQLNGLGTQTKGNAHKTTANQEGSIEKLGNERLMYLLLNFMVSEHHETWHSQPLTMLMVTGP